MPPQWVFDLGTEEGRKKKVHWRHWEDGRGQVRCPRPHLRMQPMQLPRAATALPGPILSQKPPTSLG